MRLLNGDAGNCPRLPASAARSWGPGAPTVLIGSLPAARIGDACVCVGPPGLDHQGIGDGHDQRDARGPAG